MARRRVKPDPVIGLFDDFIKSTIEFPLAGTRTKKRKR